MTDVTEMVKRMARAAYEEFSGYNPEDCDGWWYGKDDGKPYDWRREADRTSAGAEGFIRCARAALKALREPTAAMIDAGNKYDFAAEVWREMVDAALGGNHD